MEPAQKSSIELSNPSVATTYSLGVRGRSQQVWAFTFGLPGLDAHPWPWDWTVRPAPRLQHTHTMGDDDALGISSARGGPRFLGGREDRGPSPVHCSIAAPTLTSEGVMT